MCMICSAEISDEQPFLIVYQRDSSTGEFFALLQCSRCGNPVCTCGHTASWHGGEDDEWPCEQCDCEDFNENTMEPMFDIEDDE